MRISQAEVDEERERVALDQSTVAVRKGETLSERQLLEALMLPSANNVAALLAVHAAGSIGAFVEQMNATASELGMSQTTTRTPAASKRARSRPRRDQVKLARAAMQDPTFAEIVAKPSAELPVAGRVPNYNELVGHDGYVGIKTGSDEAAGGCLLFAKRMTVGGQDLHRARRDLRPARRRTGERGAGGRRRDWPARSPKRCRTRVVVPAGTTVMTLENADGDTVPVKTRGRCARSAGRGSGPRSTSTSAAAPQRRARANGWGR